MKKLKVIIILMLSFILAFSVFVCADTPTMSSLKKQEEAIKKQVQKTQQSIDKKKLEKKAVSKMVEELDSKLQLTEQELDNVEQQLTILDSQVAIKKRELERATIDADGQKVLLKKRVRVMYETGSVGYLSVILDSTSFGDFITRLDYLKKIVDYDVALLNNMKTYRDNVAQKKALLQNEVNQKEAVKTQIGAKRTGDSSQVR